MAKKIYVITVGDYSDYGIDRIYSTSQKALEYLDTVSTEHRLEVYDLDEPIERHTQVYRVIFRFNKKEVYSAYAMPDMCYKDLICFHDDPFDDSKTIDIYVESDGKKRALKVASERYGAIIAREETMYPYLRCSVVKDEYLTKTAHFDFYTGELVLVNNQQLITEIPEFIKANLKVKRIPPTFYKVL